MKAFLSVALLAFASLAQAACPDLSGKYRPFYETDQADVVTTVIFSQHGCDTLSISGYAIGKKFFESHSTNYGLQNLRLDGSPSPKGFECLWNSFPGVCASYRAGEKFIVKTADPGKAGIVDDEKHGVCSYTVSRFAKDAQGNLLETPYGHCEDHWEGDLAPIIWPKAETAK